ncbi:hypothetical protein ACIBI8_40415 [Streptomyces sp. NPDC050529]
MSTDRTTIATAFLGATIAGIVAVSHPALIPALTLSLAAFGALYLFLKL